MHIMMNTQTVTGEEEMEVHTVARYDAHLQEGIPTELAAAALHTLAVADAYGYLEVVRCCQPCAAGTAAATAWLAAPVEEVGSMAVQLALPAWCWKGRARMAQRPAVPAPAAWGD